MLTRWLDLRRSTGWLLLPTRTYLRLRSVLLLPLLAFGAQRGVLSPIACTVRVIAELLPGTAPYRQRLATENTFHRAHRTANGIACASLQRKRKGGAAVVPFAFTEAERSELAATTGTLIRTDQWLREDRQPCVPDQPVARPPSTSR